jgi:hypothetical protein
LFVIAIAACTPRPKMAVGSMCCCKQQVSKPYTLFRIIERE